jgi:glutamate-ammonia-ligase adenylyltransferase
MALAGAQADSYRTRFLARDDAGAVSEDAKDLGALVMCAYPELGRTAKAQDLEKLARGTKVARDVRTYKKAFFSQLSDLLNPALVQKRLREFAAREKLRVALREVLYADVDVDTTARELSDLAEVCIEVALSEARLWADNRFGHAVAPDGTPIGLSVIGMGKLGGRELNAGSDVDLLVVYESDDGSVVSDEKGTSDLSVHELMTRITQRMVGTLEAVTDDGIVWRVDMRLRPEGTRGPLVNSLGALERYYETWGRTWERAALLRARPVAGDLAFGARALEALHPFVWRRNVNPHIARELTELVVRARAEGAKENDLKLGSGGIREAEFFVQSLQLIWGGRDEELRKPNTLEAVRRLRSRGFVTEREMRTLIEGYVFLRRLEHRVQFATMRQTHEFPGPEIVDVVARSVGLPDGAALLVETNRVRGTVTRLLASLSLAEDAPHDLSVQKLFAALDEQDEAAVLSALPNGMREAAGPDLGRHLVVLARRPDFPLGPKTRDSFPGFPERLVLALSDAADPEQAARLLVSFFSRLVTPSIYARALATDERATRRVVSLFGASSFLAESLLAQPELFDRLLFLRRAPGPGDARAAVDEEVLAKRATTTADDDPVETLVSALRRAKSRVMLEVGLADLGGELTTREAANVLSELADETLERATAAALGERGLEGGLAVIAMGKLGGRELGYGSDLDLFFVYEGTEDQAEAYVRSAQRVMRLLGAPHGDGPGYELDARLRPSGNQGLLVVSIDAFARYHGQGTGTGRAEDWERQALVKARFAAGDAHLGARVLLIAHRAAYEGGPPPKEKIAEMRQRMEIELAGERQTKGRARYDLKLGHGGITDVEFAVQYLQMKHGKDPRVRTTDTENALFALEACGYLDALAAGTMREGYIFLRRLEQRLRVLSGTSNTLLEEGAFGLTLLARRMGMRDGPRGTAQEGLLRRYLAVTRELRLVWTAIA